MRQEDNIKKLKDNLALIMCVCSIVVGWTWVQARLSAVEVKAEENKTTLEQLEAIKTNVYLLCVNNDLDCIR